MANHRIAAASPHQPEKARTLTLKRPGTELYLRVGDGRLWVAVDRAWRSSGKCKSMTLMSAGCELGAVTLERVYADDAPGIETQHILWLGGGGMVYLANASEYRRVKSLIWPKE